MGILFIFVIDFNSKMIVFDVINMLHMSNIIRKITDITAICYAYISRIRNNLNSEKYYSLSVIKASTEQE